MSCSPCARSTCHGCGQRRGALAGLLGDGGGLLGDDGDGGSLARLQVAIRAAAPPAVAVVVRLLERVYAVLQQAAATGLNNGVPGTATRTNALDQCAAAADRLRAEDPARTATRDEWETARTITIGAIGIYGGVTEATAYQDRILDQLIADLVDNLEKLPRDLGSGIGTGIAIVGGVAVLAGVFWLRGLVRERKAARSTDP